MRKYGWMMILILSFCMLMPLTVRADDRFVVDQADLLSPEEERRLEAKVQEMSEKWKQDFVVVTTLDAKGKDSEAYADDYYDNHGYRENGVLYLVDKDNNNIWISTSGTMIRFLTDVRIERVIDAGYESLKAGAYGEGFLEMLVQTEVYMEDGIPDQQYNYDTETGKVSRYRSITGGELMFAIILSAAAAVIFVVSVRGSYKTHGGYTYPFREKGKIDFVRREDHFVNQIVNRRKISQNTSSGGHSGGRSSTHTSGSGHSHGGGGRSL